MFNFTFQALTWGFLIGLAPILIHLINMMRHRRVQWAAMEFLLQSYKKHRKWVWLKQLILLLLRILAILLIVAMLAQWNPKKRWFDSLGGRVTHHYVLLDDSFSMADLDGAQSVFSKANNAISQIALQAANGGNHQMTLLRFSKIAERNSEDETQTQISQVADINAEPIDREFEVLLNETLQKPVTQLSSGPLPALRVIKEYLQDDPNEDRIVYVVSDFRSSDWENPKEIREELSGIEDKGAEIQLVRCATETRKNLAISRLQPQNETRAANLSMFVDVTVNNFGESPANKVRVKIASTFFDPADAEAAGEQDQQVLTIDRIPAGGSVTEQIQVTFPAAGKHLVSASLADDDAVAADNSRWTVIDLPDALPVLLVDGSESQVNAYFLASAFDPSQTAKTGIRPELMDNNQFQTIEPEILRRYRAVYLLDIPRISQRAQEALEAYASEGGGIAIFLGENVQTRAYNDRLYRDGKGLLPFPLASSGFLVPPLEPNTPDIVVNEHPIFRTFLGQLNPMIRGVRIEQYYRPREGWDRPEVPGKPVVRLHNQLPLAMERNFGAGRVVCFTTCFDETWSNWPKDPSFIVTMLKLHSYLTANGRTVEERTVGESIVAYLDGQMFGEKVQFNVPSRSEQDNTYEIEAPLAGDTGQRLVRLGKRNDVGERDEQTDLAGVYTLSAETLDGKPYFDRFALNVDSSEGDLSVTSGDQLEVSFDNMNVKLTSPADYSQSGIRQAGGIPSLVLMGILIVLLMGEQFLAYLISYHPPAGGTQ